MVKTKQSTQLPRFEKIDEYKEAQQERQQKAQELQNTATEAKAVVALKKKQYEDLLRNSVRDGEDKSVELAALEEETERLDREARTKDRAAKVFNKVSPQKVTAEDVITAFNEYSQSYHENHVKTTLATVRELKEKYAEAVFEAEKVLRYHENERLTSANAIGYRSHSTRLKELGKGTMPEQEYTYISDYDLKQIYMGMRPNSLR